MLAYAPFAHTARHRRYCPLCNTRRSFFASNLALQITLAKCTPAKYDKSADERMLRQ